MALFQLASEFQMTGDQPQAVDRLIRGIERGRSYQTLMGVTGSGKTFTMANIVAKLQRTTLVLAHNKTLAAQLATEFREFFPDNAVEYFVSYYDYYQPEAYVPRTDTYIEKETEVNDEIDRLRHAATRSLLTRKDVLIVASVSCIYGLGDPQDYLSFVATLKKGEKRSLQRLTRTLVDMQYERNEIDFHRGTFRVLGDTLDIFPAYEELALRISFWGDEIEQLLEMDPLTGEVLADRDEIHLYPAKHWVTPSEKMVQARRTISEELDERLSLLRSENKVLEAARLESRSRYDLEMLQELGYCSGIENYSRHLSGRAPGSTPWTLLDYFPNDFLLFIDESHMTIPQVRGMYFGDLSRKRTLVDFGFRLPSALDNRPLNFPEFESRLNQVVFVSATPGPYEQTHSAQTVEQIIRPTGLLDPTIEVKPTVNQVDDLLNEINSRIERGERILVTTLTKRMAEELADYLREMNIRVHYLHSDIETLVRSEILRDLRLGVYDVVVGINLLREGLDLPEVSLVAILDADKEGYLRSNTSLVQTIGRAARHENGHVIMYADKVTNSMRNSIDETYRRREIQESHNNQHGITPQGIKKAVRDITERIRQIDPQENRNDTISLELPKDELARLIRGLQREMKEAARNLEFEKAAMLRDQVLSIRRQMALEKDEASNLGSA
ncbi:MAG: excinuclease ABC subunit UvrB [SAR202 cluster bacterium]|nr:excinuclease ABC subunit UvrB [SAR202 cluster bacterium]